MPYVEIKTTKKLSTSENTALQHCVLDACLLLGKPSERVMICIQDGLCLTRGGKTDACAFCDVRIVGVVAPETCDSFAQKLCSDLARIADSQPGCTYLSLSALGICYTDGKRPPSRKS